MATLVFDIETSAVPLDSFDESSQEYLMRPANNLPTSEEQEAKREELTRMMNLWPFTAQVVCIAMINAETLRGQVIFIADDFESNTRDVTGVDFTPVMDEVELLNQFWAVARHYDKVVTFNGRQFDVPFLYLRSAQLDVPITRKNWLGYRFATEPHCDLAEQLTFYNVSGRSGAARRFNLDFYCRIFGVDSPKSHGVTGMDVNQLMEEERYGEIAEYCLRDVFATVKLFDIWKARLAGIK
jgi:DNA polymerase elongation subunit (family B)